MNERRWANSIAGLIVGAIALTLVTAILTSAVASARTDDRVIALAGQLADANSQLRDTNDQLEALRADQADTAQRSATASRERAALLAQNANLQQQIRALVTYLRAHGIAVPRTVVRVLKRPQTAPKALAAPQPPSGPGKSGKGKARGHKKK